MKKTSNRLLAIASAVVMLITLLSACGDRTNNTQETENDTPQGTVFVPEYISLPENIENVENLYYFDDMLYFNAYGVIGQESYEQDIETYETEVEEAVEDMFYDVYGMSFYKMNLDGTGVTQMEGYAPIEIPEGKEGHININAMCIDNDGNLWTAETGNYYHIDQSGNYVDEGVVAYLRKLDENGAELALMDISDAAEGLDYFYIRSLAVDKDGLLYVSDGNQQILVFDNDGNKLFNIETTSWIENLVKLADGRVGALSYDQGRVLKVAEPSSRGWGDTYEMPMSANRVYSGGGTYDIYTSDMMNLYGNNLETGESTKLLNWINCDINSDNINSLTVLDDGRIVCLMRNYDYTDENSRMRVELAVISERPADQVPKKSILTLATLYTDYTLRGAVINFNKNSQDYRIEIKDYSEYNTQDDYSAGLMKLSTEMIAGNVPDMLSANGMPINQYISKGLLEDLYPYIDADTNLGGRDALMTDIFQAMEADGSLYQIADSFGVMTAVGSSRMLGDEMGWTVDEFSALLDSMPEGTQAFANMTASNILYYMCAMDMDEYVNWTTGECSFDSQGFIKLLEFASGFPAEIDWESGEYVSDVALVQEGKSLLMLTSMYEFQQIQMFEAMFGGDDIVFKGFPCESGIGNAFTINSGLSMTSRCKDKEGAWEFMRYLLTQEHQEKERGWQYPTNRAAFENMLEKAMEKEYMIDENGDEVELSKGSWGWDNLMVEMYATTQEQADQIMQLIKSTDKVLSLDQSMMNIISEEAETLFAGQKSAAETAGIIQSRVEIYVNEQR